MTNSARRGGLLAVLSLCALASTAVAGPARFVSIDFPGATATFAFGINPAGAIVGAYFNSGQEHAFVLRGGSFSSFDYPGAAWTEAYGISANGDIVGQYGLGNGDTHGFLLRDGDFYPVDVPGQPSTMPLGINLKGAIVGCVHSPSVNATEMHGFVWHSDADAIVQATSGTMHTAINSGGDITGYGGPTATGFDWSYVIHNGVTSWFTYPGSTFTRARSISATGDIVGVFVDAATKTTHSFLMSQGEFVQVDVDLPNARLTRAFGVNAVGDIVGYFYDNAAGPHGFLMTRRPE